MNPVTTIAVSGAAGQISYSLLFRLIAGDLLGQERKISLRLLETEAALPQLEGVAMELVDCASPLLDSIACHQDPGLAFRDADIVFLIGAKPRSAGMERADLLGMNAKIFAEQGSALGKMAHSDVRVLVVGNPVNTNALIAIRNARGLSSRNFTGMTRLDHNRAISLVAQRAGVSTAAVERVTIWGNHSTRQFPDLYQARIGGRDALEILGEDWYEETLIPGVRNRGAEVIRIRGKSSAGSAADAALGQMKDWIQGTPEGSWTSMAVASRGEYGIPRDLVCAFPVRCAGGVWEIVEGLALSESAERHIRLNVDELLSERSLVEHLL